MTIQRRCNFKFVVKFSPLFRGHGGLFRFLYNRLRHTFHFIILSGLRHHSLLVTLVTSGGIADATAEKYLGRSDQCSNFCFGWRGLLRGFCAKFPLLFGGLIDYYVDLINSIDSLLSICEIKQT